MCSGVCSACEGAGRKWSNAFAAAAHPHETVAYAKKKRWVAVRGEVCNACTGAELRNVVPPVENSADLCRVRTVRNDGDG